MLRLLVVLAVAWCCTAEAPVVNTTLGPISGFNKGTTNVFLGVPFAKPPIKELRWKAPVSPDPWTSVRESTKASPKCAQLRILKDLVQGSEDCLTVDIYMPTNPSSTPRPVMLWIHGGAFIFGTSDKYDGTGLAEAFDAVVFVIQYRLDIFGFFALEALRAEDPNSSVGNYGLQDQQLAMKWVLANAKAFGGDDEHVLLFGESAGAISVCAHLAMPSSKGLFHSAVVESGTCDNPEFFFDLDRDERFGLEYAAAVGCNQTTGAAVVECMREMSLADVMIPILKWLKHEPKWSSDAPPLAPVFMFGPTIDGSVAAGLPSLPLEAFEQKKGNVVPTIMGTNKDEGQTFCPITPLVIPGNTYPVTKKGVKNALIHLFDSATADEILEEYPRQTKLDPTESTKILAAIIRDYVFVCPTRRALRALNGEGGKTYSYSFTYPLHNLLGKLWGDYHAAEIPFVFQENNKRDDDKKMQHAFGQYWTNLALTGSPNGDTKGTLPTWPDFSETEETMLMTQPLNITSHLEHAVCDFWDKIHGRFRKARH